MIAQVSTEQVQVRLAQQDDVPAIAALLVEGFKHHYGEGLNLDAGRRMYERIYELLPERLQWLVVAVDPQNKPVGMGGIRTCESQLGHDRRTTQIMLQELGFARVVRMQTRARLVIPPPYQVQPHEAYLHSMSVTESWRGRGVASALIKHRQNMGHELGKTMIAVEVAERNFVAQRLYKRHGYTLRSRRYGPFGHLPFTSLSRFLFEKSIEDAK